MNKPPNIVLIMSDQHNAKCLGSAGHDWVRTPHLDALAARGVRLSSAFAQNPICTPSRMCFLSGQYPHNHGYYGLAGPTPHRLPSIFSELGERGYTTGALGKIHTPPAWLEPFADFYLSPGAGRVEGFRSLPKYPDYVASGRRCLTPQELAHEHWMQSIEPQGYDGYPHYLPKELSIEGYLARAAREFLDERPQERPFFLWYSTQKPHQAYVPAREFWDLYPEDLPLPPNFADDATDKIWPLRDTQRDARCNPPAQFEPRDYEALCRRKLRGYYGNVSHMDWAVGELMEALDARGLRENTIVVYSSDHGDFACEHGLLEKAPGISSDAIGRIPMIWSWPGHLPENQSRDGLAESVDVWPTAASLAGLPMLSMWDGRDLSPLLHEGTAVRDAAYTENPWLKCITTREWRMTVVPEGVFPGDAVRGELYHRQRDPWERENLYHDPRYAAVVRALQDQLYGWLVTSTRPVTAHPVPPHLSLQKGVSDVPDAFPEDGKTAPSQICRVMHEKQRHHLNYL